MRRKGINLVLTLGVILTSCSNSQFGVAHQILQETYTRSAYDRTVYTESLLRSASEFAGLDSNHELSKHILYVLQFEVDMNSRRYIDGTDSIVLHGLNSSGMEAYASMESPESSYRLFVMQEDDVVVDAVVIARDSSKYRIYELVGDIPLNVLYHSGIESFGGFSQLMNFDLFNNGEPDTSDQGSE